MEEQLPTPLSELLLLLLYLGSLTFLISSIFQYFIIKSFKNKVVLFTFLFVLRFLGIILALLVWFYGFKSSEIMFGPFLIPAFIAELIIILFLMIFREKSSSILI
jgi:hypothetical protein